MLLRDEGKLDLDDPLSAHVPEAHHGGPTLRRLLAHSSGIQREPPGEVWETLEFPRGQELLDRLADAELVLGPGEHFHYSNLAYALLGEVVARTSGTPFPDFVDERLIGPLGLTRTTWRSEAPAALGYYVEPFARTIVPEPTLEGEGVEAVGSLWSTPSDLCRWATHLATVEPMHQRAGDGRPRRLDGRPRPRPSARTAAATASSSATVARCRASSPCCSAAARKEIGAAVLTNASTPAPPSRRSCLDLAEKALELYEAAPEPWRPEQEPPPEIAELLGTWWEEGTPFVFWWEQGRLHARPEESDLPRHVSIFEADGADRYRVAEGRERGELLRVVRADDGVDREAVLGDLPGHPGADDLRLILAPAGLVEDQRRADVGDDEHRAPPAARPAPREQQRSQERRAGHHRDLDLPERERERLDQPGEERDRGDQEDGDLGARGERDLRRELHVAAVRDDDRPAVLRGVADDGDDHRGDEEVAQVELLGEDLERADEDLGDERGRDRRERRGRSA